MARKIREGKTNKHLLSACECVCRRFLRYRDRRVFAYEKALAYLLINNGRYFLLDVDIELLMFLSKLLRRFYNIPEKEFFSVTADDIEKRFMEKEMPSD